jgi:hypothetical protein
MKNDHSRKVLDRLRNGDRNPDRRHQRADVGASRGRRACCGVSAMNDRELLELAAKAAGIGGGWDWPRGAKAPTFWRDANRKAWLPLTDDGDALRLAVKLRMNVVITDAGPSVRGDRGPWCDEHCAANDDMSTATRRAIVRAAAEIGRQMP